MTTTKKLELSGRTLTLETGRLASLATSAILAQYGDTMVLVTIVQGEKQPDLDYFPLTVEYVERLYAGGRIKGSRWVKREGRPSDEAILTARLIDRSIRPLFPKEYKKAVQVVVTVLSVDGENDPGVLSIIATSAALSISSIPWAGPVSAVRVGSVAENAAAEGSKEEFIVNPRSAEIDFSDLDLVVTQAKEKTLMIEAGANQVAEEKVVKAIETALSENKKIIAFIEELVKEVGVPKKEVEKDKKKEEVLLRIEKAYKDEIEKLQAQMLKKENAGELLSELVEKIFEEEREEIERKRIAEAVDIIAKQMIRQKILKTGVRPDERKPEDIRPISGSVSILPRTHGSAIFQRGQTQALTVVTLGAPGLEQLIESAEGEETKSYMHHYSMPPYSVGEVGRMFGPSRREIGHGALAERAIFPVIPKAEQFPYTIRVVTEVLSSNGSTSMAATCGSTLSLMDAGVPITAPVGGIAIGLMTDSKSSKYVLLSDIIGLEDFAGDMDFKVAGTKDGITAIQLDVKIDGLTLEMVKESLLRAKTGRLHILEKMLAVLPQSRTGVSRFAPKVEVLHVDIEKIGEIIGPGGRVIRAIIAKTGATVNVEDDGSVTITGPDEQNVDQAKEWIEGLIREVKVGEEFEGEVKRILPFGAFVEVLPGKEGMVHVSQMSQDFVKDPNDVVKIGQKVKVKVIEIDDQGRINLSMLMEPKARAERRPPVDHARDDSRFQSRSGPSRDRNRDRFRRPRY